MAAKLPNAEGEIFRRPMAGEIQSAENNDDMFQQPMAVKLRNLNIISQPKAPTNRLQIVSS